MLAAILVAGGQACDALARGPRGPASATAARDRLAGSPAARARLHEQADRLLGGEPALALSVSVTRFSAAALGSVLALTGSGLGGAVDHLPAIDALWLTGCGQAILVKTGLLVATALLIASGNLLGSRPRLIAANQRPELGEPGVRFLRGLVSGEVNLVTGILFAAAVLSSLAPPPPAFSLPPSALARVGLGTVARAVTRAGYQLQLLVSPNRAAAPDSVAVRIARNGQPVRGASVTLAFNMTTMEMPQEEYPLTETQAGVLAGGAGVGDGRRLGPEPPDHRRGGLPFSALILDEANG